MNQMIAQDRNQKARLGLSRESRHPAHTVLFHSDHIRQIVLRRALSWLRNYAANLLQNDAIIGRHPDTAALWALQNDSLSMASVISSLGVTGRSIIRGVALFTQHGALPTDKNFRNRKRFTPGRLSS